ncbi:MAG TPA: UDP-glucose 4-epimerase GalE [Bdellovibrionota bacterium]|nr:UDP-glucose 4-epimerase GalE [Bdellovibrionota bacterium]
MADTFLITGSSGYVGSHFVKFFAQAGRRVVGLDLVPPPSLLTPYLASHAVADMADERAVERLCGSNRVTAVIHCAAKCLVGESVERPDLYMDHNFARARKLAEAIERSGVGTFLFSSTAAVYGEPKSTPILDSHPRKPINPYGESKRRFEDHLIEREKTGGLHVGIFRYFNAAGADPGKELGESHDPETHLIPNAIRTALGLRTSFDLFGTDYPTRDGTCERDFIHVWDLADAHLRLVDRMKGGGAGGVYNLGTGRGFTVKEVLDEIDRQAKTKLSRRMRPRRPGDPAVLVADPSKAKKELGWTPKFSDLSTIVSSALSWHRSSGDS